MQINLIKIFFIVFVVFYQTKTYAANIDKDEFNYKYLSNYFSSLVSYDNQNNKDALKYFNLTRSLQSKNTSYLRKYIFALINVGQISRAIKEIKYLKNKKKTDFFEMNILLLIDNLTKKDYVKSKVTLSDLKNFQEENTYEHIIYQTLKSYFYLFEKKIKYENNNKFGRLTEITNSFQNCYIDSKKTNSSFLNLINSGEDDYSRYMFFYLAKKLEEKDYETVRNISSTIDPISNGLLVLQSKYWIDESNFKKFNNIFSCKNERHLLSEFFFLIANLYSAEEEYNLSNFYLNIAYYLNPKFYYNLTLLVENNFITENYNTSNKILNKFNNYDDAYKWYKIKKYSKIIYETENKIKSFNFIESKFLKIKNPSIKIIFDMANVYKSYKKYEKAIELYTLIMKRIDKDSVAYADILYRRGGSYERIGNYEASDNDLLNSLKLIPDDPYVTNYLAYSWLERNYKIKEALNMLQEAYEQKKNDPYIIDSVGWAYYLVSEYEKAEKYLLKAIKLMPNDPIVNDHFGDILWMLNKKLQARYYWKNALIQDETEEKMKKTIQEKLLNGIKKL